MLKEEELIVDEGRFTGEEMAAINAKHVRLRGSMDYKYPPRESCCRSECGFTDYYKKKDKPPESHRCFLAVGHEGPCEFSSECADRT